MGSYRIVRNVDATSHGRCAWVRIRLHRMTPSGQKQRSRRPVHFFFRLTSNLSWQLHFYFYNVIPIFSPLLNYRDKIIHQLLCLITYLKVVPSLSDLATVALSEVGLGVVYLSYITSSIKTLAAHWRHAFTSSQSLQAAAGEPRRSTMSWNWCATITEWVTYQGIFIWWHLLLACNHQLLE